MMGAEIATGPAFANLADELAAEREAKTGNDMVSSAPN